MALRRTGRWTGTATRPTGGIRPFRRSGPQERLHPISGRSPTNTGGARVGTPGAPPTPGQPSPAAPVMSCPMGIRNGRDRPVVRAGRWRAEKTIHDPAVIPPPIADADVVTLDDRRREIRRRTQEARERVAELEARRQELRDRSGLSPTEKAERAAEALEQAADAAARAAELAREGYQHAARGFQQAAAGHDQAAEALELRAAGRPEPREELLRRAREHREAAESDRHEAGVDLAAADKPTDPP